MRESSGFKIIKDMAIHNCGQCLNPTLLLTRNEWIEHAKPFPVKEEYELIYQLSHDEEFDKFAIEFAKQKKLKLIRIYTRYAQKRLSGKGIVIPEVKEFLSLLLNA